MVNSGTFFAYLVVAYIQQNVAMFVGYVVPYVALLLSAIIFISGAGPSRGGKMDDRLFYTLLFSAI